MKKRCFNSACSSIELLALPLMPAVAEPKGAGCGIMPLDHNHLNAVVDLSGPGILFSARDLLPGLSQSHATVEDRSFIC